MQNLIINFFHRHDRKESMLLSMFYTYFFVLSIFIIISLWVGQYQDAVVNFITIVLSAIIFKKYKQGKSLRTTAIWILIVMELHSGIMIGSNHPDNVSIIFPFIYIAPFFFFFTMKEALLATLIQFIYWGIVTAITLALHPEFHVLVSTVSYLDNMTVTFIILFVGVFYQLITEASYQKLQDANKEKDKLLQMIHHKIRNNLNFISSLLGLQIRHIKKNPAFDTLETLKESRVRVQSIALSHKVLYNSQDMKHIEIEKYIKNLTTLVNGIYNKEVELICKTHKIILTEDLVHRLGLIINELLNKSLQNTQKKIEIFIEITQENEKYLFVYHDKLLSFEEKTESFGERLINIIVEQMQAKLKISKSDGVKYRVWFTS